MSVSIILVLVLGGIGAGFLTGLIGVGGGVVMVPVMYQLFLYQGLSSKAAFTTAVATSLAVMIFSALMAAYTYYRQHLLRPRLLVGAGAGALLGAALGARVMLASDDGIVRLAFGLFLWTVAASMFLPQAQARPHDHIPSWRFQAALLLVGASMGFISALFGVGGGALLVPALVVLFGVPIHSAVATSTAIVALTALFGSGNYLWLEPHHDSPSLMVGWVDVQAWLLMLPGALFATRYGVRLATRLSRARLRAALVIFQIAIGARFVFF